MTAFASLGAALVAVSLSVAPAQLAAIDEATRVPAPGVLAWASFLGDDGEIESGTPWSSGATWSAIARADWTEVDDSARPARSQPHSRIIGDVVDAGSSARVVAIVGSVDGSVPVGAGLAAAASATGSRAAIVVVIDPDGRLVVRSLPSGPVANLGVSTASAIVDAVVELSLQVIDGVAIATARPLDQRQPTVVVRVDVPGSVGGPVTANEAYGIVANSTTNVWFAAVRVEVPA
jgi:hypothetical protein